ncbi:NAD(P)H dehydrogenase (quinone) [Actinopolyspora lacussalsi]|nr:NAD(P)H dehydrogenase (quinone) [Actinopolyspora lacussalsi]
MDARIAVVYYSATGNVHATAEAFAEGATETGAEVRLRRVPELAPAAAIDSNPEWRSHLNETAHIVEATLEDLKWANGYAFGTPTRFGNVTAQLKQFIDTAGGLWEAGEFVNKPATGFTSSYELHGGQESTLLSMYNVLHHWGALIVPTGYVDYDISHNAGGNPYGISTASSEGMPSKDQIKAAKFQGGRLAQIASQLAPLRSS